jgi:hypothetical protein
MPNGALKHGTQAEVKDPAKQMEYGASSFSLHSKILLVRFLRETDSNTRLWISPFVSPLRRSIPVSDIVY